MAARFPEGYVVQAGDLTSVRAVIDDFRAMVFNLSSIDRLTHVILGCWMAGAFPRREHQRARPLHANEKNPLRTRPREAGEEMPESWIIVFYFLFNLFTLVAVDWVTGTVMQRPRVVPMVILNALVVLNIPREIRQGREFTAFLSSCSGMVLMMATFGLTCFPYMVLSAPNPENSLTVVNAVSTDKTLGNMLVIALIGVPIVLIPNSNVAWTLCDWVLRSRVPWPRTERPGGSCLSGPDRCSETRRFRRRQAAPSSPSGKEECPQNGTNVCNSKVQKNTGNGITCTACFYSIFRGKVKITSHSY